MLNVLLFYWGEILPQDRIRGVIRDSTGTGLAFSVTGLVHAKDSSIVKGALSDDKGHFEFNAIKAGSYLLKSSQPGYEVTWSGPFVKDSVSDLELPPVIMRSSGVQLKNVD